MTVILVLADVILVAYLVGRVALSRRRGERASVPPTDGVSVFREEDRNALLPTDDERAAIRAAIETYFEPHPWVMFEFGTIVFADGSTERELEERARLKLQRFGAVVVGTRTADFNASRFVGGEILVACRDPDIANILVYPSGSEWTDAEQSVAGWVGRGRRDADTRFLEVVDRRL